MKSITPLFTVLALIASTSTAVELSGRSRLFKATALYERPTFSSSSASTIVPQNGVLGLNLLAFGCVSNGAACGPQFQAAIDAAMTQGRALLVPAGVYNVNQTLIVPLGQGPFTLRGEGKYLTKIVASPGSAPFALINVTWGSIDAENTNVEISDVGFYAENEAEYGVYAPGLTRSYFNRVFFDGAVKSGCLHGGWIDVFSQCSFNGNKYAGLQLTEASNNVVIDGCSFESGRGFDSGNGYGIYIQDGSQISIVNTVIEGNDNVAIWANRVQGLAIRSCYFEFNQVLGPRTISYGVGSTHGGNVTFFADIVLNGGKSDEALGTGSGGTTVVGAEIVGNTFCPHGGQRKGYRNVTNVALLPAAVTGATVTDNRMMCYDEGMSFFYLGNNQFFTVQDVTLSGNHGRGYKAVGHFPMDFQLSDPFKNFTRANTAGGIRIDFLSDKGNMEFGRGLSRKGFKFAKGSQTPGTAPTPAQEWFSTVLGNPNGVVLEGPVCYPHGRIQRNDSYVISMPERGASQIMGRKLSPLVYTDFNGLPVRAKIWVKGLSPDTVFTLVFYPGGDVPGEGINIPVFSADWYVAENPSEDGWVEMNIASLLNVPRGGQNEETAAAIGFQISNDRTDGGAAEVAISGYGPNLAPVGQNIEETFEDLCS